MAKYVLVAFDDDTDADTFVERGQRYGDSYEVRGVYKRPTLFCDHPEAAVSRAVGERWGWTIHAAEGCNKAVRGLQHCRNLLSVGDRDLLPWAVTVVEGFSSVDEMKAKYREYHQYRDANPYISVRDARRKG